MRPLHVAVAFEVPAESRSAPRKQFGPRKLHQSARGADGLKAVTFPADVTSSYFTQSVPTPSSCSLLFHDPPSSSTYLPACLPPPSHSPLPSPFELLLQQNEGTRMSWLGKKTRNIICLSLTCTSVFAKSKARLCFLAF